MNCPNCGHEIAPIAVTSFTPRQRDLLVFVRDYVAANGVTPTYRQIANWIGLDSPSGVHRLVEELIERGAVHRMPKKARALVITDEAKAIIDKVSELPRASGRAPRASGVSTRTSPPDVKSSLTTRPVPSPAAPAVLSEKVTNV